MRKPDPVPELTVEEYLARERDGQIRHEYAAGRVFAMAGASEEHNRIVLNVASLILAAVRGGPCRVFASDMKVRVERVFYYPDVFVTCDPTDGDRHFKERPAIVVEVLSDGTEAVDPGEKLYNYRRIGALDAYVLVSQEARRVEVYRRRADANGWSYEVIEGENAVLTFARPALELPLAAIYDGV